MAKMQVKLSLSQIRKWDFAAYMSNKNLTILSHTTRPPVGRVQVTKVKDMKSRGLMLTCDTIVYKNYDGSKNI